MDILNYYQYNDTLASGAQPAAEEISALKQNGFEAVVNISPVSTRNALKEEAQLVEQHAMDYVHFPVDCSNLRPIHYTTFKGIMNGFEGKKVFVHCGGNIKSSNLLHMYHVLEKGVDEAKSLRILKQIQDPEEKWFAYFKLMGMQGLKN
jgi:protein tyrosine phosphatase (PTP) superfamily phosphohydrolase (DUF442 family)